MVFIIDPDIYMIDNITKWNIEVYPYLLLDLIN